MLSLRHHNLKLAAPCLDCEKRQPGCHGTCEAYKQWAESARRLNEEMKPGDAAAYLVDRMYAQKKEWRR